MNSPSYSATPAKIFRSNRLEPSSKVVELFFSADQDQIYKERNANANLTEYTGKVSVVVRVENADGFGPSQAADWPVGTATLGGSDRIEGSPGGRAGTLASNASTYSATGLVL